MTAQKFNVGERVIKTSGYRYVGLIKAAFVNSFDDWRYVVENEDAPGMLHIFNGEQLEHAE